MRAPLLLAGLALLAACKPPPTDAGLSRELPEAEPTYPPDPLPSPETEGAIWANSSEPGRIIYGIPGEPALIALDCLVGARIRIARLSPADEGAGAMLALVGNGAIGRISLDASARGRAFIWQGELAADAFELEPLAGPRQITATLPGAGMVTINPSAVPMQFLSRCREGAGGLKPGEEQTQAQAQHPPQGAGVQTGS